MAGYILALAFLAVSVTRFSARMKLRRRGVRTRARPEGESWAGGIYSAHFVYRDAERRRHRLSVSPGDVPDMGKSWIEVVYDPERPRRARTAYELERPLWRSAEGVFGLVGVMIAAGCTAYVIWSQG
ncbi:hypothetical protein AB0E27_32260 [Streptomyces sparsogenes]|uniref:hypothetical protein n=1 Tax=Streptomyces sparsogenes TaxID=67365 RepID=UPI00340DA371